MDERLTITDVARSIGVTPRTIMRWEKAGKIRKSKRDWRGWRFYYKEDLAEIKRFYETSYEYNEEESTVTDAHQGGIAFASVAAVTFLAIFSLCNIAFAVNYNFTHKEEDAVTETEQTVDINLDKLAVVQPQSLPIAEPVKYTLGPDDVIAIEVRRHPEFSGEYTVNSEGKIEYKFIGDIIVSGLTKNEVKERLKGILSEYIISPEIDVRIVAYLSKVFYVVGEVGRPGKFYMRGDTITVREALVQAGLPTESASMRGCRLIAPDHSGDNNYVRVNAYNLLYRGDLRWNLEMEPGNVLYVPSTVMAKIIRVISPVRGAVGQGTGLAEQGVVIVP